MAEKSPIGEQRNQLGRAVELHRVHLGMKRKDLAAAAELSYPYISEIENGAKEPSAKALRKIAESLRLSVAELLATAESFNVNAEERSERPESGLGGALSTPPGVLAFRARGPLPDAAEPVDPGERSPAAPAGESGESDEIERLVVTAVREAIADWAGDELADLVRREVQRVLADLASTEEGRA